MIASCVHVLTCDSHLDHNSFCIIPNSSVMIFHNHFKTSAVLKLWTSKTANSPSTFDLDSCPHVTRLNYVPSGSIPCHKNRCRMRLVFSLTQRSKSRNDVKNIGIVDNTKLLKVSLPPSDKYRPIQPSDRFSTINGNQPSLTTLPYATVRLDI